MDEIQRKKGCKDMINAFGAMLTKLTFPEIIVSEQIASLQVELDFQTLIDGKNETFSKERTRMLYLIKDYMKLLLEYKDAKNKYELPTKHLIGVVKLDSKDTITINNEKD